MTPLKRHIAFLVLLAIPYAAAPAFAHESNAQYLANEGLMVTHGDTKILFDPLFRESYGNYLLLPQPMQAALYKGEPPYDGIDAVFISHHHGDHFSPADILRLLKEQDQLLLYAPRQAVTALRKIASDEALPIFDRVTAVDLDYPQAPVTLVSDGLLIEAVRIPHAGWPTGRVDVENIVWRVTLEETTTVLHMGDADPNDVHFARDQDYWGNNQPDMAFPPYWFFLSDDGREILSNRIGADQNIGVHVPAAVPHDPLLRSVEMRGLNLFTQPGDTRVISSE